MHNPIAGRGRAGALADRLASTFTSRGHTVERCHTPAVESDHSLTPLLREMDAAVIVGGDGAMRRAAPLLIDAAVPTCNFPSGTENLFAREFRMPPDPRAVLRALERRDILDVDVGLCAGHVFLVMASVGADAAVVHRLASRRSGPITHASYARHILAELATGRCPLVTVHADGERIVDRRRGVVIVANSRQYALRIDPAPRASPTDGRLDVVFFPAGPSAAAFAWAILFRFRLGALSARFGAIAATAQTITIETHDHYARAQLDGDAVTWQSGAPLETRCLVRRLRVLKPA